ncbi:tRNAHis guanylyltransferase-domain-containing protein [Pisolithus albus]|nr:tRNAHis guanylyltransferase-domain-containing protein [Pisolithus albus]
MANSKYAYVRNYELSDSLLPGCFLVCRLDGHSFHKFSEEHGFAKPNDKRALELMDRAAMDVMTEYKDIVLAFGESDEFSFLLRRTTSLYNRRQAKILTILTSYFTSCYVFHWSEYFPDTPMRYPPSFDGRIVLYPDERSVRDYFAWRQVDTHINNLYNTIFWALVQQGGKTAAEAHATLRGTASAAKHEMLFQQFNINYNDISDRYKRGSVLVRVVRAVPHHPARPRDAPEIASKTSTGHTVTEQVSTDEPAGGKKRARAMVEVLHCDIVRDEFWKARSYILAG